MQRLFRQVQGTAYLPTEVTTNPASEVRLTPPASSLLLPRRKEFYCCYYFYDSFRVVFTA